MRWKLWRYWDDIVGVSIARTSVPVEVTGRRLLIWVKSSGQMQDLYYVTDAIRDQVNKFLGSNKISIVRFTLENNKVPQDNAMPDGFMGE